MLAAALGAVLALAAGIGPLAAALGAWLAQPAFALALSWHRGSRPRPRAARDLVGAAASLLVLWAGGMALVAVLVAWPLAALHDSGSLAAALALSVAASAALLGLWRTWPLWHGSDAEGGLLGARWQALAQQDVQAWPGSAWCWPGRDCSPRPHAGRWRWPMRCCRRCCTPACNGWRRRRR